MKKVLALSLVCALFALSAQAQHPGAEQFKRHRFEQRMMHRGPQFRHPGMMKQRHELMKHRMMRQHMMRQHHAAPQQRALFQKRMQMQRRKMMLHRQLMHRRVI